MARHRTTVDIAPLKAQINARIARAITIEARKELCHTLESILHNANMYRGFSYIDGWTGNETYRHEYY